MYFSQRKTLGEIHTSKANPRRIKHALAEEDEDEPSLIVKRQKLNDPLRNQHIHRMMNLSAELQTSKKNAARYGLDLEDMEDLLQELDGVVDDMDMLDE